VICASRTIVGGMKGVHICSRPAANVFLVFLLLGAQAGALVHAFKHDPGKVQENTCASCTTASQLLAACIGNSMDTSIPRDSLCLSSVQVRLPDSTDSLVVRQRGPPHSL